MVDIYIISAVNSISVISLIFLLAHQWKEQRQKLFGAMKLSTITMLLIFNVTLTIIKFQGNFDEKERIWATGYQQDTSSEISAHNGSLVTNIYNEVKENWPILCYSEALILQYSFLSTLLWLNAMSFDVWNSFRRLRPNADILIRQRLGSAVRTGFSHPKYIKYAIYAWCVPVVNIIVTLVMDFLPSSYTDGYILPDIGKQRCAIRNYMVSKLICRMVVSGVQVIKW